MRPPACRAFAAAVLVGLVAAACASDRQETTAPPFGSGATTMAAAPSSTEPPIRSIAMVGDSITNGSEVELREQLATLGVEVTAIDAEDGRRMTSEGAVGSGVQAVQQLAVATPPDLWVIALGTNDVGVYESEAYQLAIAELLAAVPSGAPLVWVDVYLESTPERSEEFNEVLREQLDARGRATVVDWAGLAEEDGVLRDGIHPSGFGIQQFASLVTQAVGEWVT